MKAEDAMLYGAITMKENTRLPISKEGLLAALDAAINQAVSFREWVRIESLGNSGSLDTCITEIDAHIQYLRLLRDNISEDRCNNYPPVVRKRFKHDRDLI